MELQHRVLLEYRAILNQLKPLADDQAVAVVFRRLELGWLTPGGEILQRIENQEISLPKLLRHSRVLLRKWFNDLSNQEKGRWIDLVLSVRVSEEVQIILQLSQRRLQQLRKSAQCVSQGTDSYFLEPPKSTKVSGDTHEVRPLKNRTRARVARRSVGG